MANTGAAMRLAHATGALSGVHHPVLVLVLTIFLLAQAGVPLTSGFVAKFEIIGAAVDARSFWLVVIAMLAAVVSAFLCLCIVLSVYLGSSVVSPATDNPGDVPLERLHSAAGLAIGIALAFTIGFGLFPGPIDDLARDAVPVLFAAGESGYERSVSKALLRHWS